MSIELLIANVTPAGRGYALAFEREMIAAGMETDLEKAHFLAQVCHESSGLTRFVENMNYGAKGLLSTFGKYFNAERAARYARQPTMIGSRVYANRMGNGPESSGDGYRYRGHGAIQLTGRNNMRAYSLYKYNDLRILENPKLLTLPDDAAGSAVWFWEVNKCKFYALQDNIVAVSGIINVGRPTASPGSINGLQDRREWLAKIKAEQLRMVQHASKVARGVDHE